MKEIKIAILLLMLVLASFISCNDKESVEFETNATESQSIRTAINKLRSKLDENGNIDRQKNPTGSSLFDYGFSFQIPITLSFNTGTAVTVSSFEDLINITASVSDELFINGAAFPVEIEVYNDETGVIEVVTIHSEEELAAFFDVINFEDDDCECTEECNPVCVEIIDENEVAFILTFPNACYAICKGFDQSDFLEFCENDYDDTYDMDCFEFNFPLQIIAEGDETIVVDSLEDLSNITYVLNYFEFDFPLTVTTEDNVIVEITNEEQLMGLYVSCYDGCDCSDEYNPVCVDIDDIIFEFYNLCEAECEGFTEADVVDCYINTDCTEQDYIAALVSCNWLSYTDQGEEVTYEFIPSGLVSALDANGNADVGIWVITMPINGDAYVYIDITEDSSLNATWYFEDCTIDTDVYTNANTNVERDCE
ncbi:MAG: hypothetical protein HRT67_05340 [Flavobacteriaceae bacterium]|nr:hypothetical protein [Flavobacteriaceae bacterium]